MDIGSHPGFKGRLTPSICKSCPYFADRDVELIYHVPTLYEHGISDTSRATSSGERRRSFTGAAEAIPLQLKPPLKRSRSNINTYTAHSSIWPHQHISEEDLVAIVWIDDLSKFETVPNKLGGYCKLFIFVHPLENAQGLFCIRILLASGALEDHLVTHLLSLAYLASVLIVALGYQSSCRIDDCE